MICLKLWNSNLTMCFLQVNIKAISKCLWLYIKLFLMHLLSIFRKPRGWKQNSTGCCTHSYTCHPDVGKQEPLLCGPKLWHCHHRAAHCMGSFPQRWTELGGTRLHPLSHRCQSTVGAGPEGLSDAILWFQTPRVLQLWPHDQSGDLQPYERHTVEIWQSSHGWTGDRSRKIYWWEHFGQF